ncbi:hypothetical protein VCRA2116O29_110083 [Vibrio crassostreae]|nr:hypothetical protein VCRA2116O29_110083 [Vibrio crassostreae]CAK2410878.1 hypothetical protein VCRA2119O48_150006 [Vibrio crassostreae]CAK3564707.1 hypothetical protein VCRA2123O74_110019 [Vibrio crassostreae]CAK3789229.1 hypothetical protein VCRA212O16_150099 [Vibrio crassostreae]
MIKPHGVKHVGLLFQFSSKSTIYAHNVLIYKYLHFQIYSILGLINAVLQIYSSI